jgi:hypothetical protein
MRRPLAKPTSLVQQEIGLIGVMKSSLDGVMETLAPESQMTSKVSSGFMANLALRGSMKAGRAVGLGTDRVDEV